MSFGVTKSLVQKGYNVLLLQDSKENGNVYQWTMENLNTNSNNKIYWENLDMSNSEEINRILSKFI